MEAELFRALSRTLSTFWAKKVTNSQILIIWNRRQMGSGTPWVYEKKMKGNHEVLEIPDKMVNVCQTMFSWMSGSKTSIT